MKLRIVGCSGSFPGPESAASSYLLSAHDGTREWNIVLDMGNGSVGQLQRYIGLEDIDAIFLSHLHPDHCLDLCGLYVALKWRPEGSRGKRTPVHAPAAASDYLAQAYNLQPESEMVEVFDFRHHNDDESVRVGPFKVRPFAVNHPVPEAYALRVEVTDAAGERRVVTYSGDTDVCTALDEAAAGADLFLCEAAFEEGRDDAISNVHLTGRRAGETAQRAAAKRLLLTHLPVWTRSTVVSAEAGEVYDGPVAVVHAGEVYDV